MQSSIPSAVAEPGRIPEARYSYYRRCQVFRRNGEQCKAPAEKGSYICHAHAGQLAMAVRREQERRAVLAEAVAEMRRRGRLAFEMKDLFMDFNGIQVTIAVMARALIAGRIDCKTAGRLVVQLQTFSKLLRMVHRKGRKGRQVAPQISADERRLNKDKDLTTKDTKKHEGVQEAKSAKNWAAGQYAETRITFMPNVAAFADIRGWPHGPPGWAGAA